MAANMTNEVPGRTIGDLLVSLGLILVVVCVLWPFAIPGAFDHGWGWMMMACALGALPLIGLGVLIKIARRICQAIESKP